MRQALKAILGAVGPLALALALAGCGGAASAPTATNIAFDSPAITGTSIPALYTCDGKNVAPPLEWGAVPSSTRELAVLVLGLTPTSSGGSSVSIEWAVAGVNPALHRLAAGELPPGANVGLSSDGKRRYSVCPAKGKSKIYSFALYAVPPSITVAPGFRGLQLLGEIASANSPTAASAGGRFSVTYTRR